MKSICPLKKCRHRRLSLAKYAKNRPFIALFEFVTNDVLEVLLVSVLERLKPVVLCESRFLETNDGPFLLFLGHSANVLNYYVVFCYLNVMRERNISFSYLLHTMSIYHVQRLLAADHNSHPVQAHFWLNSSISEK
jgi:hypothetical protein